MPQLMEVTEVLAKINAEAAASKVLREKRPHVRDCTKMAVFDYVRQGDVYVAKVCNVDGCMYPFTPSAEGQIDFINTIKENVQFDTWPGSRHKVFVAKLNTGLASTNRNQCVVWRDKLLDALLARYPEIRPVYTRFNLMVTPVYALSPWRIDHHEHARIDFSEGGFIITRQLDLMQRAFVVD